MVASDQQILAKRISYQTSVRVESKFIKNSSLEKKIYESPLSILAEVLYTITVRHCPPAPAPVPAPAPALHCAGSLSRQSTRVCDKLWFIVPLNDSARGEGRGTDPGTKLGSGFLIWIKFLGVPYLSELYIIFTEPGSTASRADPF